MMRGLKRKQSDTSENKKPAKMSLKEPSFGLNGTATMSTNQVYTYESTEKTISRKMKCMQEKRAKKQFCDVTFSTEGKEIEAHRLVLASCSPYFDVMFAGNFKESKEKEVKMPGVDWETLESIVNFCYTGKIQITDSNCFIVLPAASFLQIIELQEECARFIQAGLLPTNCLAIQNFANKYACKELEKYASDYAVQHFLDVMATDSYLQLPLDNLRELLHSDNLGVKSEDQVFAAVRKWIVHDEANRKQFLFQLLETIRMPMLSAQFLVQTVSQDPLIKAQVKCRDIVENVKDLLLLPAEVAMNSPLSKSIHAKQSPRVSYTHHGLFEDNARRSVLTVHIPAFTQFINHTQPFLSDPIVVCGLSWRVIAKVIRTNSHSPTFGNIRHGLTLSNHSTLSFLGISLRRENDSRGKSSYCTVDAELRVKAQKDVVEDLVHNIRHVFYPTENSESRVWNDTPCSTLTNASYLLNDTLVLSAAISVGSVRRIS